MVRKISIGCNQVAVTDATSSSISNHYFAMEDAIKKVSLGKMFKRMYKNYFNEASTIKLNSRVMKEVEVVSSEDRGLLRIVEEKTTKAAEHYVLPLPFRNESLDMSNNRKQAIKRLIHLKDRFKRNPSYFADYKKFIDDLIKKEYARKEDTRPPGKTCFIPQYGVYHPNKPGKIRVVFDCRAEFDGQSLNKELLTGPHLTNQIVGVLQGFEKIALHSWQI